MFNFGIKNDHAKASPQQYELCSHQSHCNNHLHHPAHRSCCVSGPSCCSAISPPQCCQSKPPSHSGPSCNAPCHSCHPASCPWRGLTKGPASQGYYWRDYIPGEIPHDAVAGINEKYVGQVSFCETLLPVTIYTDKNTAVGERGGSKIFTKNIKILCSADPNNIYWEHVNYSQVTNEQMKNVVKGGHQDGYNLYIGVANYEGDWRIGKVVHQNNIHSRGLQICNNSGNSILLSEFHILKYKPNTPRRQVARSNKKVEEIKKKKLQNRLKQFHEQQKQGRRNEYLKGRGLTDEKVRQDFYWRDYIPGEIPHDAIKGTNELYIGQVSYDSCNLPATIYPSNNVAITEKNGKQVIRENIKILCSPDASKFYWERYPSIFANHSRFGPQPFPQHQQGLLFGATTNQFSTGMPQSQTTTIFGSSNTQGSSTSGLPQNQVTFGSSNTQGSSTSGLPQNQVTFGSSNTQGSSTSGLPQNQVTFGSSNTQGSSTSGLPQNQVTFGSSNTQGTTTSGMPLNIASGFFGAQESQGISSLGTPSNQSGILFGLPQNQLQDTPKVQQSFSFGIPQILGLPNQKEQPNENDIKEEETHEEKDSKSAEETTSVADETNEPTTSDISQNVATAFGNSQISTAVITFAGRQNQCVTVEAQESNVSGQPQNQVKQDKMTQQNEKVNSQGGGNFGSIQTPGTTTFDGGISTASGTVQTQAGGVTFGCAQTQSASAQTQGALGQSQTQGTSALFAQPQNQGTLAGFSQPQSQGTSSIFGQSQSQETSALFGQAQTQRTSVLFGQSQPQGTSAGFGQSQSHGTSTNFGQPQTQASSALFGQSQMQGSYAGFGQPQSHGTSTHFGQPQTQGTSSLFGQSQTQGFGRSSCFGNNFFRPAQSFPLNQMLREAIKGGHQDSLDLYIGKTFHEGEWKIGKVMRVNGFMKTLYIWGRFNETIMFSEFEILKYRSD